MNTRTILIILPAVLVLLGIFALVRSDKSENTVQADPTTFEECAARYPVQETYPRRCVSESGMIFTESVTTPPMPAPSTPNEPAQPTTSGIPNLITVTAPTANQRVASPLTITGQARGPWYFEATFPVEVRNAAGTVIAQHYAEAQSDWMTENYVPFRATLSFPAQPAGSKGTVVLHKSNASGDPARDQSVSIPVTF